MNQFSVVSRDDQREGFSPVRNPSNGLTTQVGDCGSSAGFRGGLDGRNGKRSRKKLCSPVLLHALASSLLRVWGRWRLSPLLDGEQAVGGVTSVGGAIKHPLEVRKIKHLYILKVFNFNFFRTATAAALLH